MSAPNYSTTFPPTSAPLFFYDARSIVTETAMKTALPFACTLILAACTSGGITPVTFSGESGSFGGDNILRNDVFNLIQKMEDARFSCRNIPAVKSRIIKQGRENGLPRSDEEWQVHACGTLHRYDVRLKGDARGETNFTVGLKHGGK